ncbi:hypothetical protein [Pseudomonas oryzihabitans]|uniref:hypothetical protein n=1 Tax=Pseudomonas oryzihabitans TaxID=47885 RepID=UPI0011A26977|nr:hypothetical protein [Pseudomonas psychrotolerans]
MGLLLRDTVIMEAVFQDHVSLADIQRWLAHIHDLTVHRQPFYFISSTPPGTTLAGGYRALQSSWFRRHRASFQAYCQGLVRIAQDTAEHDRLDTPALRAAWGVPYFVTLSRLEGLQWIVERLVKDANAQ